MGSAFSTWFVAWWTTTPAREVWDDMMLLHLITSVVLLSALALMVQNEKNGA